MTAPPIYIQEKIHPKAIIEDLRKVSQGETPAQADLFSDFNGIDFDEVVDFYQHEQHWSNRLILGDSLEVMTSLAERETLKREVQCIYMDPPYGVKFGSNWQVSTRKRDVRDGSIPDATRQPEQVKAFRDTWLDDRHSYLTYLRDRLTAASLLLAPTGSIFVQISDTNEHLVRGLLDEIFGADNFCALLVFKKTTGANSPVARVNVVATVSDFILWYAHDRDQVKYRQLYVDRSPDEEAGFNQIEGDTRFRYENASSPGFSETLSRPFEWKGKEYLPPAGAHWKTTPGGMRRLAWANRLVARGRTVNYKRDALDFPVTPLTHLWTDIRLGYASDQKTYVVQTSSKVVERCILMTTDPGDLVLDPTCGSGTSAYVSEQWGRRWITIDTSRVALTLTRQRLIAARLPRYRLLDPVGKDLRRGFEYETVAHVTLKSIANNPQIFEDSSLHDISVAIRNNSERETLYDRPKVESAVVRVTGPFTVESLSASVTLYSEGRGNATPASVEAGDYLMAIIENLRTAGVQNSVRSQRLTFDRLDVWPGHFIHAVGEYAEDGGARRAAITVGPQYGTVDADLVRDAAKEAAGFFDLLVVCGFTFDAYIADEFKQLGNLTILKANMNPDLSMGGDLLKKTGTGNLFTVFGEPDIDVRRANGEIEVEIRGLDVYDPTTGQIRSHTTADIACWFIDTAYDGNSFFVRHAYFTGAGDPYKALKAALRADIDEGVWASLYSTVSRPFEVPASGRIAVKVINHYGDEVMKVYEVADAKVLRILPRRYEGRIDPAELLVADEEPDGG
ncbi:MAG TPA: site-specific DNA-methyltransferase [Candidatus Micrarchaeaceae archaeon]|nr:site-specific DNA-methyltransferase [Candidatus Micrarchaeaceae archaeon]